MSWKRCSGSVGTGFSKVRSEVKAERLFENAILVNRTNQFIINTIEDGENGVGGSEER